VNGREQEIVTGTGSGTRRRPQGFQQRPYAGLLGSQPQGAGETEVSQGGGERDGGSLLLNEFSEFFGGSQIGLMDDARLAVDAGAFDEVGLLSPITRIPSGYAILKVIPEKEGEKTENVSRARLEAISAYGSVLYSSSVSGLLEAEEALLRFPKVSGWQQDPVLTFTTQRTAVCSAMARGY
jgi:hypothetical protein